MNLEFKSLVFGLLLAFLILSPSLFGSDTLRPMYKGELNLADSTVVGSPRTIEAEFPIEAGHVYVLQYRINPKSYADSLIVEFPHWAKVETFIDRKLIGKSGHKIPLSKRSFPLANRNLINLGQLNGPITLTAYLEHSPQGPVPPSDFSSYLHQYDELVLKDAQQRQYIYFFIGLYAFIILFNAFLTYSLRSKSYLLFIVLISINLYALVHNFGYAVEWFHFWDSYTWYYGFIDIIFSSLFGFVILHFTKLFLQLEKYAPKTNWFILGLRGLLVLAILPTIVGRVDIAYEMSSLFGLLVVLFVFGVSVYSLVKKVPFANYFLLAMSSFIIGLAIFLLKEIGIIPTNSFTAYSLYIGGAVQALLFAMALGGRINLLESQNKSQQLKLISQLKENQSLQEKVNRELESKVQARTRALEKQKSFLEKKKTEIEENLNYARNIQKAVINYQKDFDAFPIDYFVIQKTKNFVNGNFCWSHKINADTLIWATVDCSQTGTPGALLSLVAHVLLNKIIVEKGITKPNLVLGELRKGMLQTFDMDGVMFDNVEKMYLSICRLDLRTNKLSHSNAGGIVLLSHNNSLKDISGKENPMNFISDELQTFEESYSDLSQGDILYCFSEKMIPNKEIHEFCAFIQANSYLDLQVQKGLFTNQWQNKAGKTLEEMQVVSVRLI